MSVVGGLLSGKMQSALIQSSVSSFALHLDRFTKQPKVKSVKIRLKLSIICTLHMTVFHYISNYSDYSRSFYHSETFLIYKTTHPLIVLLWQCLKPWVCFDMYEWTMCMDTVKLFFRMWICCNWWPAIFRSFHRFSSGFESDWITSFCWAIPL